MSLASYASACSGLVQELKESLTRADIDELRKDCAALGMDLWISWVSGNDAQVLEFVSSTPSARRARKPWKEPQTLRRLVLASIWHVRQAKIVLDAVDRANLSPGGSYREMAAIAGEVYNEIVFDNKVPLWPFEGNNPFVT